MPCLPMEAMLLTLCPPLPFSLPPVCLRNLCSSPPPPPMSPAAHVISTVRLSSVRSALRWLPVVPRCRHIQARRRSASPLLQDCRCAVCPARPLHLPWLCCSTQVCLLFIASWSKTVSSVIDGQMLVDMPRMLVDTPRMSANAEEGNEKLLQIKMV